MTATSSRYDFRDIMALLDKAEKGEVPETPPRTKKEEEGEGDSEGGKGRKAVGLGEHRVRAMIGGDGEEGIDGEGSRGGRGGRGGGGE